MKLYHLLLLTALVSGCFGSAPGVPGEAKRDGLPAGWLDDGNGKILQDVVTWQSCGCQRYAPNGVLVDVDRIELRLGNASKTLYVVSQTWEPLGSVDTPDDPIVFPAGWAALTAWPWLVPSVLETTKQSVEGWISLYGLRGWRSEDSHGFGLRFNFSSPSLQSDGILDTVVDYKFQSRPGSIPTQVTEVISSQGDKHSTTIWSGGGGTPRPIPGGGASAWQSSLPVSVADRVGPPETGEMHFSLRGAIEIAKSQDPVVAEYFGSHNPYVREAGRATDLSVAGQTIRRKWDITVGDHTSSLEFSVTEELWVPGLPPIDQLYTVAATPPTTKGLPDPGEPVRMVVLDAAFERCSEYRGGEPRVFRYADDGLRLSIGEDVVGIFSQYACGLTSVEGLRMNIFDGMLMAEPN